MKRDNLPFLLTEDLHKHRPSQLSILKDQCLQNIAVMEANSCLDGLGYFGLDYKMCRLQCDN